MAPLSKATETQGRGTEATILGRGFSHVVARAARTRRGFTLLELLLAITVMSIVTALIAVSWRVAGDWASVAAHQRRALQLPRVADMIRSQWAERRTSLDLEKPGQTVFMARGRVEFITSLAVLDRTLPLVIASYVVERDDAPTAPAGTYRLVYNERAVIDTRAPQRASAPDDAGGHRALDASATSVPGLVQPPSRSTVLLSACSELVLEYFDNGEEARRAAQKREEERRSEAEADALLRGESPEAAKERAELAARSGEEEEPVTQWKPLEETPESPPPAVRIRGVHQGEAFSCLMVVADSR